MAAEEKADLAHSHTFMAGSLATADTGNLLTPSKELEAILKNPRLARLLLFGNDLRRKLCMVIIWRGVDAEEHVQ